MLSAVIEDPLANDNHMSAKRGYPGADSGAADSDAEDDPKRLCIDEDGLNLQCNKCSYVAKWRSDLERHMKVRYFVALIGSLAMVRSALETVRLTNCRCFYKSSRVAK